MWGYTISEANLAVFSAVTVSQTSSLTREECMRFGGGHESEIAPSSAIDKAQREQSLS